MHSPTYVKVLSKVDHIHQNTSRGAVHFFSWLSTTISCQLLPLSHHHYFTNLINLPYKRRHTIGKIDGIQGYDTASNRMPPLPSPEIPIDSLVSGVMGHNWVTTLLEVPYNVPPQLIAAVFPPPNPPVAPPTPNQHIRERGNVVDSRIYMGGVDPTMVDPTTATPSKPSSASGINFSINSINKSFKHQSNRSSYTSST